MFTTVPLVWFALTILLWLMAVFAIWSRKSSHGRTASWLSFFAMSPAAAGFLVISLGWPTPLLTAPGGEYDVLGVKMILQRGIYVLLDKGDEPRYYWLPWNRQMADELQKAMEEKREGADVRLTMPPFEFSWERRPQVYTLPPPKVLPDKPPQDEPPIRYRTL